VVLPRVVGRAVRIFETIVLHEEVLGYNASSDASAGLMLIRSVRWRVVKSRTDVS